VELQEVCLVVSQSRSKGNTGAWFPAHPRIGSLGNVSSHISDWVPRANETIRMVSINPAAISTVTGNSEPIHGTVVIQVVIGSSPSLASVGDITVLSDSTISDQTNPATPSPTDIDFRKVGDGVHFAEENAELSPTDLLLITLPVTEICEELLDKLSTYVTASSIPTVPTNNNQLLNGKGYLTSATLPTIPTNTNQLLNGAGYITSASLPTVPAYIGLGDQSDGGGNSYGLICDPNYTMNYVNAYLKYHVNGTDLRLNCRSSSSSSIFMDYGNSNVFRFKSNGTMMVKNWSSQSQYSFIYPNTNGTVALTSDLAWTKNGSNIYRGSGRVGIQISSPAVPLHVASQSSGGGTFTSGFYARSQAAGSGYASRS